MSRIQSHADPKRQLQQHIAEILAATKAIVEQHGPSPWRDQGEALACDLARLHDLGKGSSAFQRYIAAPGAYMGDPREKAHTLLSLVLTAHHLISQESPASPLPPTKLLSLALAVLGHHGGAPGSDEALTGKLSDDVWRDVLCKQIPTVDIDALSQETGLTLTTIDDPERAVRSAKRRLQRALDDWRALPRGEMVEARVIARAAYSILLEADKAFLAVDRRTIYDYLHRARGALPPSKVDALREGLTKTPMSELRERARAAVQTGLDARRGEPILTLTLPTGAGKTLLAARWALGERESRSGAETRAPHPIIIVALPMLAIVDQTERVWRELLGANEDDGDTLLPYHSLSERAYDPELPEGTADFFIDTWRSEVIVTTFDQLLLALFSDKAKHAMRYHHLLDARIVIDEVQCVPPVLWTALSHGLRALTALGDTKVLAMSATPSPCLSGVGAVEALPDPEALYKDLARYEIRLEHQSLLGFDAFITQTTQRCRDALARSEGTLVTVNVRATAQETFDRLERAGLDPLLLSGDMTPSHRLAVIDAIKHNPARVVVSTQCVEAGVDIDMHHVIRDLAPLDSIVQIAGRCNRHACRREPGTVTVVHVQGPSGRDDAKDIYDSVLLDCTQEALRGLTTVPERDVLALCRSFYGRVSNRKYQGDSVFQKWARIEEPIDVRALLRGEDRGQTPVLVLERDPGLGPEIQKALSLQDRWDRRRALRALSARLAKQTVNVSQKVLDSLRTALLYGMWTGLLAGQYHPVRGIDSRVPA